MYGVLTLNLIQGYTGCIVYESTHVCAKIIRQRHFDAAALHYLIILFHSCCQNKRAFETQYLSVCLKTLTLSGASRLCLPDNHQAHILLYSSRHVTPELSRTGNLTPLSLSDSDSCYATDRRHTSPIRSDLLQCVCVKRMLREPDSIAAKAGFGVL